MDFDKKQRVQSDEEARAWALSRKMFQHDQATRLAAAREEGYQEGLRLGREEGYQEGLRLGREEARREAPRWRREIARRMLDEGFEIPMVARHTRLSEAEVTELRDESSDGKQAPGA